MARTRSSGTLIARASDGASRASGSMNSLTSISPACGLCSHSVSVVIRDFDTVCASIAPDEAYTPLHVDGNGMLSGAITFQRMQSDAGRKPEIVERCRSV